MLHSVSSRKLTNTRIISQVLYWDKRELKKRAEKLEKDKDAPPKNVRTELKDWIERSRQEHEECRRMSQDQEMSIVSVILALSSVSTVLSPMQHEKALEYLSLQLAIRDRDQIIRVLCQRNPDLLTSAIRDGVDAYTPMIRHVHQAVNLSDSLWDLEQFLTDMLKVAKPSGPKGQEKVPTVETFVDLLHRHQQSFHKFLHQVAKNGKEVTSWWLEYAHMAAAQFRSKDNPPPSKSVISDRMTSGGVMEAMNAAITGLSAKDQEAIKTEVVAHQKYMHELHDASAARISAVIKRDRTTPFGPGAYLARWQQLMDNTRITPATAKGPVRFGADTSVREESRKDVEGEDTGFITEDQAQKAVGGKLPVAPVAETTVRLLGPRFRKVLATG